MKILLRDLPQGHSVFERTEPKESFDLEGFVTLRTGLDVHLEVDRREQQITLRGRVEGDTEDACARCLKMVTSHLEAAIVVLADRRGADDPKDEVALEQEGSVIYHDGSELDLGPSIREAIIVEVPLAVLCRPDCPGLCPVCGGDRNLSPCNCTMSREDPRWAVLESLKNKNPDPGP